MYLGFCMRPSRMKSSFSSTQIMFESGTRVTTTGCRTVRQALNNYISTIYRIADSSARIAPRTLRVALNSLYICVLCTFYCPSRTSFIILKVLQTRLALFHLYTMFSNFTQNCGLRATLVFNSGRYVEGNNFAHCTKITFRRVD